MKNTNLGEDNVTKLIFRLAVPTIIAQVVNALYNIVDRIYIGKIGATPEIGEIALSGLGVCFPIIMIVSALSALFGIGSAPLASIKLGEGNKDGAEKILGNSFMMLVLVGLVLTPIIVIFREPLLMLFGATSNNIGYASDYLLIYIIGSVAVLVALGLNPFISAQGYAMFSMITILIGAVLNIILDPIFIFTFNMGVKGAAYATVISQIISALWVVLFLLGKKTVLKLRAKNFKLNGKILLSMMALGVSPFIMQSTESLVQIVFNRGINQYGGEMRDTYLATITCMMSIMQLISLPMMGLAQGAQPVISFNYGAGKIDRAKKGFNVLLITSLVFSATFGLTVIAFPKIFILLFNDSANLLMIAPRLTRIFFIGMVIFGIQNACQNTFLAFGQAKISLFLALLRKIILLIPLAIILPMSLGVEGIFYAEPIADIIAVLTTGTVFAFSYKKILNKRVDALNK